MGVVRVHAHDHVVWAADLGYMLESVTSGFPQPAVVLVRDDVDRVRGGQLFEHLGRTIRAAVVDRDDPVAVPGLAETRVDLLDERLKGLFFVVCRQEHEDHVGACASLFGDSRRRSSNGPQPFEIPPGIDTRPNPRDAGIPRLFAISVITRRAGGALVPRRARFGVAQTIQLSRFAGGRYASRASRSSVRRSSNRAWISSRTAWQRRSFRG